MAQHPHLSLFVWHLITRVLQHHWASFVSYMGTLPYLLLPCRMVAPGRFRCALCLPACLHTTPRCCAPALHTHTIPYTLTTPSALAMPHPFLFSFPCHHTLAWVLVIVAAFMLGPQPSDGLRHALALLPVFSALLPKTNAALPVILRSLSIWRWWRWEAGRLGRWRVEAGAEATAAIKPVAGRRHSNIIVCE